MNEERYILFDQYLQDELSAEEKMKFEKDLSEDVELASEFAIFKELQEHLGNKFGNETELNAFKDNLKTISGEHFKVNKPKVFRLKPWHYAAAASITLLFGLFLFNADSNPGFEDYHQYENAYFTERGTVDGDLKQAEEAFNAKQYAAAVPLFEAVLKETNTPEIKYFYGVSLLESNNIAAAEIVFDELQSGASIYKNKAIWNLALLKLKQKDYKSCKKILKTIPEDYEDYGRVQELLDKLD